MTFSTFYISLFYELSSMEFVIRLDKTFNINFYSNIGASLKCSRERNRNLISRTSFDNGQK